MASSLPEGSAGQSHPTISTESRLLIEAENFKSFRNLRLELNPFSVLIGPNASGKSNVVELLRFLRDIAESGLADAISLQGGPAFVRNANLGASIPLTIRTRYVAAETPHMRDVLRLGPGRFALLHEQSYDLTIKFNRRGEGYSVESEDYSASFTTAVRKAKRTQRINRAWMTINNTAGRISSTLRFENPRAAMDADDLMYVPPAVRRRKIDRTASMWERVSTRIPAFGSTEPFRYVAIYDIDPKLPKRLLPVGGRATLDEDGGNLAIVLRKLLARSELKKRFNALITDVLPFAKRMRVDTVAGKSLLLRMDDNLLSHTSLPASLLSDGTVGVTALVVALFFEEAPFVLIEEPERNLHPKLIAQIVQIMKQASADRYVLVTTHSPEVVKHSGLDALVLVQRDESGFSTVSRASDSERTRRLLAEDIGIDELYVQDLLTYK